MNHTFDNLFAVYQPESGQKVRNLLSQEIIDADGSPGPNFSRAAPRAANEVNRYSIDPTHTGFYSLLPQPATTYATGVPPGVPDARFPSNLPNGPFQITKYVSYSDHTANQRLNAGL